MRRLHARIHGIQAPMPTRLTPGSLDTTAAGMRAALLCLAAATTAQLYEPDITPQEPQRRFVVTAGCPSTLDASSEVRLFVAVPSAASYTQRRQYTGEAACFLLFFWCAAALPGAAVPRRCGPSAAAVDRRACATCPSRVLASTGRRQSAATVRAGCAALGELRP